MAKGKRLHSFSADKEKSTPYKSRTDPPMYFLQVTYDGNEPEDTVEWDGVLYDRTDHISIDFNAIPDHVRDELAQATLDAVKRYFSQAENEEEYQKWLTEKRAREALKGDR